nr:hypothetical protein [Tanacetum cinerariifolium]
TRVDPNLLNGFNMTTNGNGDDVPPAGGGDLPVPDLRTMEELCQPTLNGRGGPIAPIAIQATNFGLKNDMIQQLQNSCQFHGLPGGTFMKRHPEECYDLIENMTAHHKDWDTSVQRTTVGQTQNVYAVGAYNQGGHSYQPQGNRNFLSYHSDNYLRPPGFNQNQNRSNQNYKNRNQGNNHGNVQWNNQGRNQFFQGASHGQNPPPAYQASAYQGLGYQALVQQAPIPQPQVVTTIEFTNYMKANDAILKNMQTNMTSLKNSNLELKNMFGQFMKMNTASSSSSGTLPSNTITNPKEDLKGITTQSGIAYKGPTIPTTSSPSKVVEHETEVTKDTVPPTNNGSTKDVQPPVVQVETETPNSEPVVAPVIEDALILMPKFGSTIKSLLTNKQKLFELARTPLNEHCSAVLLKKLPEKLGTPTNFSSRSQLAVEESGLAEPKLGNPGLDKPMLDKLEVGFDHD